MTTRETYEALHRIALHGPREQQLEPMQGSVREVVGLQTEARFSGHRLSVDEPVEFGGSGTAANPAEVLLAALGASLQVTCRVHALLMGIALEQVAVELNGTLDTRGFFDADPAVRAGFDGIGVTLRLRSAAPRAQLDALLARVERACPVLDMLRAPTPVRVQADVQSSTPE